MTDTYVRLSLAIDFSEYSTGMEPQRLSAVQNKSSAAVKERIFQRQPDLVFRSC